MGKGKAIKVLDIHESMNIPLIDRRFNHPQVVQNVVDQQHTCFLKPESTAGWKSPLRKKQRYTCYICQWEGHLHVEHEGGISTIEHLKSSEKPPSLWWWKTQVFNIHFFATSAPWYYMHFKTPRYLQDHPLCSSSRSSMHALAEWPESKSTPECVTLWRTSFSCQPKCTYIHLCCMYIYKNIDTHPWLYIE